MLLNLTATVEAAIPASTVCFGTTMGLAYGLYPSLQRPTGQEQEIIQAAIWAVKNNDYPLSETVQTIARRYDSVLAGCTEIPLLLGSHPCYNPATILKAHLKGRVLVVGGMGIEAGKEFTNTLSSPHRQVYRTDNPHPCRIAALTGDGPSPAKSIAATIQATWDHYGPMHTVMACNTAHLFHTEVLDRLN